MPYSNYSNTVAGQNHNIQFIYLTTVKSDKAKTRKEHCHKHVIPEEH